MVQLQKKRIEELDMVKGIAIVLVFFRHINEMTGISNLGNFYTRIFSTFFELFMLLFFFCSGYVFSTKGTVLQNIRKKAKQLLLPILKYGLFFTALYFLRYIVVEKRTLLWFADNTLTNFAGLLNWNIRLGEVVPNQMKYAFVAYWFLFQLFAAFCLVIPIRKLTEGKHISVRIVSAVILMGVAMLLNQFDIQNTLATTFNSGVPYIFVLINIFGFASVLMIGNLMKEIGFFDLDAQPKVSTFVTALVCLAVSVVLFATFKDTGYALQYGKWGEYGCLSIPVTAVGGLALTYFLIFCMHYVKKLAVVKKALCFLGENSLYILLLHVGVAEVICWIGGFWYDIYSEPFPMEKLSFVNYAITILGTAIVIAGFFTVRHFMKRKKSLKEIASK